MKTPAKRVKDEAVFNQNDVKLGGTMNMKSKKLILNFLSKKNTGQGQSRYVAVVDKKNAV